MTASRHILTATLLVALTTSAAGAQEAPEADLDVVPRTLDDADEPAAPAEAAGEDTEEAEEDPRGALPTPDAVIDRLAPGRRDVAATEAALEEAPAAEAPAPEAPAAAQTEPVAPPQITASLITQLIAEVRDVDLRPSLDLSPVVRDARWRQVWAKVAVEECEDAHALATEVVGTRKDEPGIELALARIQLCGTKSSKREGLATLARLARRDDEVGYMANRVLGEDVAAIPAPAGEETSTSLKRRIAAAEALAETDLDAAVAALKELADEAHSGWSWYRVRKVEAALLERAGRVDDAAQVWRAIYLRARDWRHGAKIEDEVEAFEQRRDVDVLGVAARVDRMRELIFRGRYKQARAASKSNAKVLKIKGKRLKGWELYRKAVEDEQRRERERAVERFAQAEELVEHPAVRARVYFDWARALRRIHRDAEAVALYDRLCREYPTDHLCAESLYQAGRLLQYDNHHAEALERFYWLVGLHPESSYVPDGLWRGAFSSFLLGDYAGAEPMLERIIAFHHDETDASELTIGLKARYWLGVMALKRGDTPRAVRLLQEAIDHGPLTWYGRLAAARMESVGATPQVKLPLSRLTSEDLASLELVRVPRDPRLVPAAAFARLGMWEDARDEVRRQLKRYPAPEGAERMLAALYLADGRPDMAHWIMKKHIAPSGPTYATLRDWGTAFPLHFMELSHRWGENADVSPFLVQAIIRQESGFRTEAKSPVGALGLMQLMPRTARYVARLFLDDATKYKRKHIFEPERNIKLGAMYIRMHTAYAGDRVPLALAGYNAGPANLKRWYKEYGDRELDAWVESITYREARGYVRKVFTSYTTYAALYGNELPDVTLELPENLRSWGDVPDMERIKKGATIASIDSLEGLAARE
jgi:soluble lytic murein transglycosylase